MATVELINACERENLSDDCFGALNELNVVRLAFLVDSNRWSRWLLGDLASNLLLHLLRYHTYQNTGTESALQIAEILIAKKANPTWQRIRSFQDCTLHQDCHPRMMKLLLNHTDIASIDCTRCYSETPLHVQAVLGHPENVRMLIEANADIERGDFLRTKALTKAVINRRPRAVEVLITYGADLGSLDFFDGDAVNEARKSKSVKKAIRKIKDKLLSLKSGSRFVFPTALVNLAMEYVIDPRIYLALIG